MDYAAKRPAAANYVYPRQQLSAPIEQAFSCKKDKIVNTQ